MRIRFPSCCLVKSLNEDIANSDINLQKEAQQHRKKNTNIFNKLQTPYSPLNISFNKYAYFIGHFGNI